MMMVVAVTTLINKPEKLSFLKSLHQNKYQIFASLKVKFVFNSRRQTDFSSLEDNLKPVSVD